MYESIRKKQNLKRINLKCDLEEVMMLRDLFGAFVPGWHMKKEHWNTIAVDDSIPQKDIEQMTNVSCDLVIDQLPKKERLILESRYGESKKRWWRPT